MAKQYAAEKKRLQREIERLSKQAAALEKKQRAPIIAGIVREMKQYEITPEDISQAYGSKGRATKGAAKRSSGKVKTPVPPKFRNPETGDEWSGRGRAPNWVTAAEQAGRNRAEFLIDGGAAGEAKGVEQTQTGASHENAQA